MRHPTTPGTWSRMRSLLDCWPRKIQTPNPKFQTFDAWCLLFVTRVLVGRQPAEQLLHRVDFREIAARVVITAYLPASQLEAAPRVNIACSRAAQVNDRGEILLLLEGRGRDLVARQRIRDAAVEERRSHFDGVARHDTGVEGVEPARSEVVPRAVFDHGVVVDAVAPGLPESAVG